MPRTEAANERIRQDTRTRILAGATEAIARKGLAATMSDVAAAAGVSQGLPYRYFADKDALIRALVTEAVQQADGQVSPLAMPGSAALRLRALVTALVQARQARPELFLLLQHVAGDPATPADLLDLIRTRGRAVAGIMRQLITEAQAAGEAAGDDPGQLVTAVMACLEGLGRLSPGLAGQDAPRVPPAHIIARMLEPVPAPAGNGNAHGNHEEGIMSAEQTWHAQMEAGARGDWDAVEACFAPGCTWTLMPPGTTFRGPAEIAAFIKSGFAAAAEREGPAVRNEFAAGEWGVFEYTSRGVIDAQRAAQFAEKIKAAGPAADQLAGQFLEGRTFEIPVCFIYHVNASGQIDTVNEYAATPALL